MSTVTNKMHFTEILLLPLRVSLRLGLVRNTIFAVEDHNGAGVYLNTLKYDVGTGI